MIAQLVGVIVEKAPTSVVLDVSGVGYEILIPVSTYESLGDIGQRMKLMTYQHVREDALLLFGFASKKEKLMFARLLSVSGVGPKLALGILSGTTIDNLTLCIVNGDIDRLTKLPGIGKKTAQRLSLELRDKLEDVTGVPGAALAAAVPSESIGKLEEAVVGLISLGYARADAQRSLSKILAAEPDLPLDELIRRSLQKA